MTCPEKISPVPRLKDDLLALNKLFDKPSPISVPVWDNNLFYVYYGFADASRSAFGIFYHKE